MRSTLSSSTQGLVQGRIRNLAGDEGQDLPPLPVDAEKPGRAVEAGALQTERAAEA